MKTKISTIIGIVALVMICLTNVNATSGSNKEFNLKDAIESEKSLTIESWMLENEYWTAKTESNTEGEKAIEIESWMLDESLWN